MNTPPTIPLEEKKIKSERQKRLSAALRENLRKRKSQSQEREKSRSPNEEAPKK